MNVAVYSGSFNPLHIGHQAILSYLTREGSFDQVYLVVSPQSPFKDAAQARTGSQRYAAAVEALKRHPDIQARAEDIELTMPPPHYTIRTLDALRLREPENVFTLIIGADNLASFPRWRDYDRILLEYGIAVYPRKGHHRGHLKARLMKENPDYRIRLLPASRVDISSTEIRAALEKGEDPAPWLM